ncbi:PKD-like family lipoprotein [Porphyromonas sp.]|uniref:PKD-like family lipoprotein n=1 Tax=Porphyromonas sp. TaxID=1924944 RepID=UPI0026DC641E|nr:PKD-like family lipoprotein [Porphyromonas sp.]MDO4770444.1 PKD-like family lipoprotein [Porphyromonas sp.]
MKHIKSLVAFSIIFLLSSCYKDLGNYNYNEDIKGIEVAIEKTYAVKKEKTDFTVTIKPTIDTKGQNKELTYEWYRSLRDQDKGELISTEKDLTMVFKPKSQDPKDKLNSTYYIRLYVKDISTNTLTMRHARILLVDPYTSSWAVLHEQGGHAEIGAIEYLGDKIVTTPDALTKERGKSLQGKPLHLGVRQIPNGYAAPTWLYSINTQLFLSTTDLSEGGLISPGDNFEHKSSWNTLISKAQIQDFNPSDITGSGGGDRGYAMSTNGKIFINNPYSPVMYQVFPDPDELEGKGRITRLGVTTQGGIGYDAEGKRLVALDMTSSIWKEQEARSNPPKDLVYNKVRANVNNAADPNKIPADYIPVSIFPGYKYGVSGIAVFQQYQLYCYFISGDMSHVYTIRGREITSAMEAPVSGFYSFKKPEGLTENTPMTTGFKYANIIFYAAGNKVYKHNIVNGQTSVIYSHPDAAAKAKAIRMAVEGYVGDEVYATMKNTLGIAPERYLAIGFDTEGKGEVVVLSLDTSGDIDGAKNTYPNVQVHKGFGPITSIVFM